MLEDLTRIIRERRSAEGPHRPLVIICEGLIGAGKSTFISHLTKLLNERDISVCCCLEPIDSWKLMHGLEIFYENPQRGALIFQVMAFTTRVQSYIDAYSATPAPDVIIIERFITTDRFAFFENLYQSKLVSDEQMKLYVSIWNTWSRLIPFSEFMSDAIVLWLTPSIDTCMDRIKQRNRPNENVSREYQSSLDECYHRYLTQPHPDVPFDPKNVIVVENGENYLLQPACFEQCLTPIVRHLSNGDTKFLGCAEVAS